MLRHWICFIFCFTSVAAAAPNTTGLFEVHRRHANRSIGTQHTKAPRERFRSIKSRLLSSRSRSTPMPLTGRSAQHRSFPNKPKQTINNGGRCFAIDVHGFANLHRHPNTANPTCSCLAAISNMAVQSFCRLVGHGNPAPSPWRKRFFLLAQQCFGATYEPLFLVQSWCFGCQKAKNRFETRLWLRTSTGTALVEKRYECVSEWVRVRECVWVCVCVNASTWVSVCVQGWIGNRAYRAFSRWADALKGPTAPFFMPSRRYSGPLVCLLYWQRKPPNYNAL